MFVHVPIHTSFTYAQAYGRLVIQYNIIYILLDLVYICRPGVREFVLTLNLVYKCKMKQAAIALYLVLVGEF